VPNTYPGIKKSPKVRCVG